MLDGMWYLDVIMYSFEILCMDLYEMDYMFMELGD